jgi:hypothetical protein
MAVSAKNLSDRFWQLVQILRQSLSVTLQVLKRQFRVREFTWWILLGRTTEI